VKNIIITLFFIFSLSGNELNREINNNLYPAFSNNNDFNFNLNNSLKKYSSENDEVRYHRTVGFIGVGFLAGYGAVFIPSLVLISYGAYNVVQFSNRFPDKRNDITTNPEFFVPLYVGIVLFAVLCPGLLGLGIGLTVFGFVKAYKAGRQKVSILIEENNSNLKMGIRIRL